ncbi:hypothetical protein N7504_010305 [Penicillium tannophilum]|nr:hypothetical protein N7504_010305 [Penicillium tannophilum]
MTSVFDFCNLGREQGKWILVPEQEDRIPVVPDLSSPLCLDPNASYILAGDLGEIDRSIARWMISRGAKQLVFLSRSGHAESDVVRDMIEDIQRLGCRAVIFSCDITNTGSVEEVFRECT